MTVDSFPVSIFHAASRRLRPILAFAGFVCVLLGGALHASAAEDDILIQHGPVAVTKAEFSAYVGARIPEARRMEVLSRPGAARDMLANLFVIKMLATEARREGLHQEPALIMQLELAQDVVLSDERLNRLVNASAADIDWQALARETYLASGDRYVQPDRVSASHVLIGLQGRTEEAARALAEEVLERLRGGEDLEALAREFSDDPSALNNGGSIGAFARDRMVPEFADAAFSLSEPGELAGPIRTQFGFHIIRLDRRLPGGRAPFERVQEQIVAELRNQHLGALRQTEITRLRSLEGIRVDEDAVQRIEQAYRPGGAASGAGN